MIAADLDMAVQEYYEERAGILEYLAGLTRRQAEQTAKREAAEYRAKLWRIGYGSGSVGNGGMPGMRV